MFAFQQTLQQDCMLMEHKQQPMHYASHVYIQAAQHFVVLRTISLCNVEAVVAAALFVS